MKKHRSSSKRLLLIAAAVVAILVVVAAPVLAATNEDRRAADAFAHLLGLNDAEALAEFLALENEENESCGPACSYFADNLAEAIGYGSAEELAEELNIEDSEEQSAEDEIAQILHDSENLNQFATAVGLDGPDALAEELQVDRGDLAQALRNHQSQLEALAELQGLAEAQDIEEEEFDRLLQESSNDPQAFADSLGFPSLRALAEELELTPRELRQLLRDANPEETNKLEELAELRQIARDLGFANLGAFADHMGVESRRELVELLQDADTPREVAEALGFESVGDLAEHLGIDRDELAELLDEAKSDDGVANTDGSDDEEESAGSSVSQEAEQEAESGDVNQSFSVTNSGDNSNQSAAVQGTANTGNAQSQTSVVQSGSEAENIEVEGGSSIEVSPELDSQSQQAVDQAAAAAAEPEAQKATPAAK